MNDNVSGGKMAIIWFDSANVIGNWSHLAEKNSRAGAKIVTVFRLSWRDFICIIKKTFSNDLFCFE